MEKNVLGETSFSPALGFTEKDTLNSKKLKTEQKHSYISRPSYYNTRLQKLAPNLVKSGRAMENVQNIKVNLRIRGFYRYLMNKKLKKNQTIVAFENEHKAPNSQCYQTAYSFYDIKSCRRISTLSRVDYNWNSDEMMGGKSMKWIQRHLLKESMHIEVDDTC